MKHRTLLKCFIVLSLLATTLLTGQPTKVSAQEPQDEDSGEKLDEVAGEYLFNSAKQYALQAAKNYVLGWASPFIDPFLDGIQGKQKSIEPDVVELSQASLRQIRRIVAEETQKAVLEGLTIKERNEAAEKIRALELQINDFTAATESLSSDDEKFKIAKDRYLENLLLLSAEAVTETSFEVIDAGGKPAKNFRNAPLFMVAASMRLSVLNTKEQVDGLGSTREGEARDYIRQLKNLYVNFYEWNEDRFRGPVRCKYSRYYGYTYEINGTQQNCITGLAGSWLAEANMHAQKDREFDILKKEFFGEAQDIIDIWSDIAGIPHTKLEHKPDPAGLYPSGIYASYAKDSNGAVIWSVVSYVYLYSDKNHAARPNRYCWIEDIEEAKALTGIEQDQITERTGQTLYPELLGFCRRETYIDNSDGKLYVDANHDFPGSRGKFKTVGQAYDAAWDGAYLEIQAGSYPETLEFTNPVTLIAVGGTVTIGE